MIKTTKLLTKIALNLQFKAEKLNTNQAKTCEASRKSIFQLASSQIKAPTSNPNTKGIYLI